MGTINIGFNSTSGTQYIEEKFKEYTKKNNYEMTTKNNRSLKETRYAKNGSDFRGYKYIEYGNLSRCGKNLFMCLMYGPQFPKMYYYKLTFHQSQWKSQKEVVDTMIKIWGLEIAHHICFLGKITRLDLWLDLNISFRLANACIYKSRSQIREFYRSQLRSTYIGSQKSSNYTIFYEKPKQYSTQLDLYNSNRTSINFVRIEERFLRDKIPIQYYSEYKFLAMTDPFAGIQTYIPPQLDDIKNFPCSQITKKKLINLVKKAKILGLFDAIRSTNKNHDFARTLKPILQNHFSSLELNKRFQRKLDREIIQGFDIQTYFTELFLQQQESHFENN